MKKINRNDPCPCGSGKKYKHCCMNKNQNDTEIPEINVCDRVYTKIMDFAKNFPELETAQKKYFGGPIKTETTEEILFFSIYFFCGFRNESGERIIDMFRKKKYNYLDSDEQEVVNGLEKAWLSVFDVKKVILGTGLELEDIPFEENIWVKDISTTVKLEQEDLILAWVMPYKNQYIFPGSVLTISPDIANEIIQTIGAGIKEIEKKRPDTDDYDLTAELAWTVAPYIKKIISEEYVFPQILTSDNENMIFCEAHYTVEDKDTVIKKLEKVDGLNRDGKVFVWTKPRESRGDIESNTILGSIEIKKDSLILKTQSKERLDRGKILIEKNLGNLVKHKADSIQDPISAVKNAPKDLKLTDKKEALDPELKKKLITQVLQDSYYKWVDEKIPALDNLTPREAVKTAAGRQKVMLLIDDIEYDTRKMQDLPDFDMSFVREELGLDDENYDYIIYGYNADIDINPEEWNELDEQEKTIEIEAYHKKLGIQHTEVNMHMHAMVHCVVENQLIDKELPEVRETLERFLRAGVTRHNTVHAIGTVLIEEIYLMLKKNKTYKRDRVKKQLEKLKPKKWIV